MRTIETPLTELLKLVVAAYVNEFADEVLLDTLSRWAGKVTDSDINEYADWYTSDEAKEHGYTLEDKGHVIQCLAAWRDTYQGNE